MSETIDFVAKDGQSYQITLDDFGEEISVSFNGKKLGQITLSLRDDGDERGGYEWFHITHLELDNCRGIGIGTRCLEFHRDVFQAAITAGRDDGQKPEDGSFLTGDGPAFIDAMRKKGLVEGAE